MDLAKKCFVTFFQVDSIQQFMMRSRWSTLWSMIVTRRTTYIFFPIMKRFCLSKSGETSIGDTNRNRVDMVLTRVHLLKYSSLCICKPMIRRNIGCIIYTFMLFINIFKSLIPVYSHFNYWFLDRVILRSVFIWLILRFLSPGFALRKRFYFGGFQWMLQ